MKVTDFTGQFDISGSFLQLSLEDICIIFVSFSEKSRREGLLSLEDDIECIENNFMRKMLEAVTNGISPEDVSSMGENYLSAIHHYLEEILACCEFSINNLHRVDYDEVYMEYVNSRDTGKYRDVVFNISEDLKKIKNGNIQYDNVSDRYKDIVKLVQADYDTQIKFKSALIKNHLNSILYNNRAYNRMIITGTLSLHAEDNAFVMKEILLSHALRITVDEPDWDPGEIRIPGSGI